ncbi:MAG: AAC(3) family N-acetyltransferase [Rhodospirillales bacterium]|nr:AAC(3) family N-acetyltransferase [Rhodospirillales bacterium]
MTYSFHDLVGAYEALGLAAGDTVLATGNLGRLMAFEEPGKEAVLAAHLRALTDIIGPHGTLVVPTASTDLCNTDTPFDLLMTPTHLGPFCEYVRTQPGALRSFHPFVSYAALGTDAAEITQNVSRHAFGMETPEDRLVRRNAWHISIGLHSRFTTATNHHVEMVMGVPYRYVREYEHPVVREGEVRRELFYLHVRYMAADVERDYNARIFERFEPDHPLRRAAVGRGTLYAYRIGEFFSFMTKALAEDIYLWTHRPPKPDIYRSLM